MEHRVIIHAPIGKDARLVADVFRRSGMDCFICATTAEVVDELGKGVGALFIVDEALSADFVKSITQFLAQQQTWSDLPVLVLSKRGFDSPGMRKIYQELGNVTLIERPAQSVTLLSAANSALRARRRQYEMREIDRRKDEFLAMLAHELRNPLAPISAASELLRHVELDRERIKKTSDVIARQVDHMTGLIDDLLDVSRVSRGLIELENAICDTRSILTNAVEQVRPLIDSRRHHFTLHVPPDAGFVQGDQKRLIQVITNLLNNAAKYTPEGGSITLAMRAEQKDIVITVTDNGIGMAPNVISRVFDMFAQAERTPDRSQGGLGIGLALVKSLVELHKGSVTAYSAGTRQGSTFTVTLPRMEKSGESALPEARRRSLPSTKGRRLLVVDDNLDAARMLGMYLEEAGHEIIIEHSAQAALERAYAEIPDVCLLDIGLPDMDGNELAQRLRAQAETTNTILIAITGYGQRQDREKSIAAGFNHHFVKPVDLEKLLGILAAQDNEE